MKPAPFVLHRPKTLDEALAALAENHEDGGLVLAGGQSLVPMMALRVAYPPHLVDINGVEGLSRLEVEDGRLVIGATVRHAAFHRPVIEGCLGELLADVSRSIAHYPIRKRGTFCGSLAHADPASEWCLVAVTLGAELALASTGGRRTLDAADYLVGAMSTARESDEILLEVRLPLLPPSSTFGFYEFSRRAGDFAIGMSLVSYRIDAGRMRDVRIGLGGIEEISHRMKAAEAVLEGQAPGTEMFAEAAAVAQGNVDPMDDATTSAQYRRDLTGVVIRRALGAALARHQSQLA
ncbi:FAD binding domain-containing protein [Aquibium sp. LZ166]|uniref:FAD binding domain-containing protein n=1 Tax=Aquibium pacificus TaxID=3153579 RepID=A0ABV3SJ35_9HYPH